MAEQNSPQSDSDANRLLSRRQFLQLGASGVVVAAAGAAFGQLRFVTDVENPMAHYPSRDWERLYRDVFSYDRHYHFLCAPNDTHNCLLRAYVKNDVITRIGPSFGYGKAKDLYGN